MMKKLNIQSIFTTVIVATSVCFTSCDGYLTTLPSDSLVSDGAITTAEDTKTALNGAYAGLISVSDKDNTSYYYYGVDFIARAEVGGDDTQTNKTSDRTEQYYRYTYRQNNAPDDLWFPPYAVINRVNVLLEAIDKGEVPMSDVVKNSKGEALAIRALAHFNLLITYGAPYLKDNGASLGVPVVKEVLTAAELPARQTVAQGYAAVLEDLTDALSFIDENKNYGHFNRWAVKALLARVNLYKGDYEAAYGYAKDVVENGPYELIKNSDYVDSWKLEETSESIFDLALSSTTYAGGRELWGAVVAPSEYGAVVATKDREVDFEMVERFSDEEVLKIGILEHQRWLQERYDMGWQYGTPDPDKREFERKHKDMIPEFNGFDVSSEASKANYERLDKAEQDKDTDPMECMVAMLKMFDGLRIYRL